VICRGAISNREPGFFRVFYAPRVGEIIHNNRGGQTLNYSLAAAHQSYQSHSAIVVEIGNNANGGYVITVGSNEGDTVQNLK
jgi:hypothetical protein